MSELQSQVCQLSTIHSLACEKEESEKVDLNLNIVNCLPPKSALVSWGQTDAIPARSSGGGHGQGRWEEHMVRARQSWVQIQTHTIPVGPWTNHALCLSFSCLFLELL